MTVQDIIRAQIQHGATDLQDAYRIAWMAGIPDGLRKIGDRDRLANQGAAGAAVVAAQAAQRRAKWIKIIAPLHHAGHGAPEIARRMGISRTSVRRILHEAGLVKLNSKTDYFALAVQAHPLRCDGVTWDEIGRRLRCDKSRLRDAYNEWREQQ